MGVADPLDLPDLRGRTALVTGAGGGVGREIARSFATAGARVVMPVRSRDRAQAAVDDIMGTVPDARLVLRDLDLARLDSVRALADDLVAAADPVDLVVLNAGIVMLGEPRRTVTVDGHEAHLQTNFLGHAVLVQRLLPLLRASATRVVVQGSLAAAWTRMDWDDIESTRRYRPLRAYGLSKIALGQFGYEVARREPGLTVHLCHPGITPGTGIAPVLRSALPPAVREWSTAHLGGTPAEAAGPALLAATATVEPPAFFGPSGWLRLSGAPAAQRPFRQLTDPAGGRRAWLLAEQARAGR